jgi:poly(hydroxyalkanoate) granule-associated protein
MTRCVNKDNFSGCSPFEDIRLKTMTREDVTLDVEIEEYEEKTRNLFHKATEKVRSAVMIGIGAADLTQEKVAGYFHNGVKFVGDLEERGEKASKTRREQLHDEVDKRQGQIKDLSDKANESFDKYSEAVLTRVNIPTSEDIEGLSKQVSSLGRKVDKVRKEQQEAV